MLQLFIKDLVIEAKHGVHDHEKTGAQRFKISVELSVDSQATATDNLADTVDWSKLRDEIRETVLNNSFDLMERLAKSIGVKILENSSVNEVSVEIEKLDAFESGVPGVRLRLIRGQ